MIQLGLAESQKWSTSRVDHPVDHKNTVENPKLVYENNREKREYYNFLFFLLSTVDQLRVLYGIFVV